MTSLSPCSAFSAATAGASRLHAGHHGAQNHSRTSLPAAAAKSNCCPSSSAPSSSKISARVSWAAAVVVVGSASAPESASSDVVAGADAAWVAAGASAAGAVAAVSRDTLTSTLPQPARTPRPASPASSTMTARYRGCVTLPSLSLGPGRDSAGYIRPGEHPSADRFGSRHRDGHPDGVRGPGAHRAVALPGSGRRVIPVRTGRKRGVPSSRDGR